MTDYFDHEGESERREAAYEARERLIDEAVDEEQVAKNEETL